MRVSTVRNDNVGDGYTENRYYVKNQGTNNITVMNTQVIGAAANLVLTTAIVGSVMTITATNGSHTGANLFFEWGVTIDSLNKPVIT